MLKLLLNKTNQELYDKHLYNQSSDYEKYELSRTPQIQVPRPSIIIWKVELFFQLITHQYEWKPTV